MPQTLINVHSFLQDFNPSKFTVYSCTLIFSILFSLKLDNRINISYWFVFLPLWLWKSITILGALVGIVIWLKNPDYRISNSSYIHFKSMLISTSLQLLLLMFEILVCDKLETKRHTWTLAFVPLLFISLLSISVCVWSIKNGRSIELEFFAAINILQIILIALKLDTFINWSWIVVFIPSWILLCFAIVVILYAMIFAAIVLRSPDIGSEQRRASIHSASSSSMIFLPLLVFIIILTSKLDSPPHIMTQSYFVTCIPLFLTLMILIRLSFGSKTGSLWWFGMRTDFCTYLLTVCPCLKEYGNTSYRMNSQQHNIVVDSSLNDNNDTTRVNGPNDLVVNSQIANPNRSSDQFLYGNQQHNRQLETNQGNAKRFLFNLSKVFSRDKSQNYEDKNNSEEPIVPKLTIDVPD